MPESSRVALPSARIPCTAHPAHVLIGAIGRTTARLLGQKTSGSYEQEYVRNGEGQASQKDKKDSSKHVGEPSKGGCSRPRDMICRQHEFVMGHHRDPTVRYLAIALLTYRRLRPSSRCSQNSVNTGERIFLSTISSTKKRSKHSVSKHLSDALDYSLS